VTAFYNEWDTKTAVWLTELERRQLIAAGTVNTKSIKDLTPDDLRSHTQVHLFAGIGGWSYALRLAGWPDDRPVWTGSCPCQPFSAAGKRKGTADDRHLWPDMLRLIAEFKPPGVFGEQVASKDGREWLAGVRADLEALGYEVGCSDLCAAGVGSPHIRQRLYWVAYSKPLLAKRWAMPGGEPSKARSPESEAWQRERGGTYATSGRGPCGLGEPRSDGSQGVVEAGAARGATVGTCVVGWDEYTTILCGDGKTRRIEPSISPLAYGVPARVVRLRGYGNAIVPQVAAEFVRAFMETQQ